MDQLPRLGKRELICLLLFTCNYVVFVWRDFLSLWVLGMGYVISLWHSLSLPYNYFSNIGLACKSIYTISHSMIGLQITLKMRSKNVMKKQQPHKMDIALFAYIYDLNRDYINPPTVSRPSADLSADDRPTKIKL